MDYLVFCIRNKEKARGKYQVGRRRTENQESGMSLNSAQDSVTVCGLRDQCSGNV